MDSALPSGVHPDGPPKSTISAASTLAAALGLRQLGADASFLPRVPGRLRSGRLDAEHCDIFHDLIEAFFGADADESLDNKLVGNELRQGARCGACFTAAKPTP